MTGLGPEGTYTHGHPAAVLRSHRWRTVANSAAYLAPRLVRGASVLDVGCGPGTITAEFATLVAPGPVLGLDASEAAVSAASADHQASNLTFRTGDVYALDLADDSIDVVHAHQVLQHLADPVRALREMRRVCRPDGVVAVRDGDYAAMSWWPASPGLDRWQDLYRAVARANGGEPDAARRLVGWVRAAGFDRLEVGASAWCFADPADRAWWSETWAVRIADSPLADRALELGLATRPELDGCAAAWRAWALEGDACFVVPHAEVLAWP